MADLSAYKKPAAAAVIAGIVAASIIAVTGVQDADVLVVDGTNLGKLPAEYHQKGVALHTFGGEISAGTDLDSGQNYYELFIDNDTPVFDGKSLCVHHENPFCVRAYQLVEKSDSSGYFLHVIVTKGQYDKMVTPAGVQMGP